MCPEGPAHLFPMAQVAGNKNVHKIPHYFLAAFHVFSHVVIHFVRSFSSRNLEMENADHGEMNRFLMTKTTREMRVVLKYYLNNPLQLLFNEKPKILSSINHLLAHWSPWWPHPELHRTGDRKSEYFALSSIF